MLTEEDIGRIFIMLKEKENKFNIKEEVKKCSMCGANMIKRESKFNKGEYWWGCSQFPRCRNTAKDN